MEHHPPNLVKANPNPNNSNHKLPKPKAKGISVPISILIISLPVLYVSLTSAPPSTLFKDTTLWFLISNTIIIILAADSGIFSPSDQTADLYHEYVKHSRSRSTPVVSVHPQQPTTDKDGSKETRHLVPEPQPVIRKLSSETRYLISDSEPPSPMTNEKDSSKPKGADPSLSLTVKESCKERRGQNQNAELQRTPMVGEKESSEEKVNPKERRCDRSRSEIAIKSHGGTGSLLSRCATERRSGEAAESEYSRMSDEELNRRVEDFIWRFREIRLQELRSD